MKPTVLITGIDGYLGWTLAMYLSSRGYSIMGIDNYTRRINVEECGSWSATPIETIGNRIKLWKEYTGEDIVYSHFDLMLPTTVEKFIEDYKPHTIVHLGEIPSAPYSMINAEHANYTQVNNIIGTNNILWAMHKHTPESHLVKLGTMGEYGTPNIDIPEGFFEIEYHGRKANLTFPKSAGSFYHLSKVHDSANIDFACRVWGLRSTDIMQGVVHGINVDDVPEELTTRFDFDGIWGTAINRFCAQAIIGKTITPYGKGGQTRGYIALRDSMQCLRLAIDNPPKEGEYRVFNQFEKIYEVNDLADRVSNVAGELGHKTKVRHVPNPRVENEEHYYNPEHKHLIGLGFKPTNELEDELRITIPILEKYKKRIEAKQDSMEPTVMWK